MSIFSGMWDFIEEHADIVSLGGDAIGVARAIESNNGVAFAVSFTAFVKDLARVANIKEITPEMMAQAKPHIEGLAVLFMGEAAMAAATTK